MVSGISRRLCEKDGWSKQEVSCRGVGLSGRSGHEAQGPLWNVWQMQLAGQGLPPSVIGKHWRPFSDLVSENSLQFYAYPGHSKLWPMCQIQPTTCQGKTDFVEMWLCQLPGVICGCFHTTTTQLNNCNEEPTACRTENICSLVLFRRRLPVLSVAHSSENPLARPRSSRKMEYGSGSFELEWTFPWKWQRLLPPP